MPIFRISSEPRQYNRTWIVLQCVGILLGV